MATMKAQTGSIFFLAKGVIINLRGPRQIDAANHSHPLQHDADSMAGARCFNESN